MWDVAGLPLAPPPPHMPAATGASSWLLVAEVLPQVRLLGGFSIKQEGKAKMGWATVGSEARVQQKVVSRLPCPRSRVLELSRSALRPSRAPLRAPLRSPTKPLMKSLARLAVCNSKHTSLGFFHTAPSAHLLSSPPISAL